MCYGGLNSEGSARDQTRILVTSGFNTICASTTGAVWGEVSDSPVGICSDLILLLLALPSYSLGVGWNMWIGIINITGILLGTRIHVLGSRVKYWDTLKREI